MLTDTGLMLGVAGLLGALFVGVVADAAISWASKGDEDDCAPEDGRSPAEPGPQVLADGGDGVADSAPGDLIDWAGPEDAAAGPVWDWVDTGTPAAGDLSDWTGVDEAEALVDAGGTGTETGDFASPGPVLSLAEVTEGDDLAQIDDFDAATDQLVVVYDPELHPDPALTLEPTADGSGMTVMLDGVPLAEVPGATDLRPEQVQLKPSMPLAA